jgi:hypothetical protein
MLIIEIVLTVLAWRKGWYAFALLPVAACFAVGYCLGLAGAPNAIVLGFVGDIMAIGVLGVMVAQGRKAVEVPAQS